MALGSTQPLTETITGNISWGVKAAGARAYNLTTFMCQLSINLGASTSWNPKGLSRPVMGLLYILVGLIKLGSVVPLSLAVFIICLLIKQRSIHIGFVLRRSRGLEAKVQRRLIKNRTGKEVKCSFFGLT
jgi:hypothetical protein